MERKRGAGPRPALGDDFRAPILTGRVVFVSSHQKDGCLRTYARYGLGIMSCNECCVMSVVMNAAMNVAFTPVYLKSISNYNRLEMIKI